MLRLFVAHLMCVAKFGTKEDANSMLVDVDPPVETTAADTAHFAPFVVHEEKRTVTAEVCRDITKNGALKELKISAADDWGEWGGSHAAMQGVANTCRNGLQQTNGNSVKKKSRAAVILRGEGFRNFGSQHTNGTCCDIGVQAQKDVYKSHEALFRGIEVRVFG
jgi:hypothetical protein